MKISVSALGGGQFSIAYECSFHNQTHAVGVETFDQLMDFIGSVLMIEVPLTFHVELGEPMDCNNPIEYYGDIDNSMPWDCSPLT